LESKRRQRDTRRQEDYIFADAIKRNLDEQNDFEKKKREQDLLAKQKYREELERQMEDTNKKRIYKDVMSEHERKINSVDLKAYENMEADLLNAKIIGIKDYANVSGNHYSARASPKEEQRKASPQYTSNYFRHYNQRLLEPTLKNMQDPSVVFMRNNTSNLSYGYKKKAGLDKYFFPKNDTGSPLQLAGKVQVIKPNMPMEYYNALELPKNMYDDYRKFDAEKRGELLGN
jgi:hypothetical protein